MADVQTKIHAKAREAISQEQERAVEYAYMLAEQFRTDVQDPVFQARLMDICECYYRMGYINALAWSADRMMEARQGPNADVSSIQDETFGDLHHG